MKKLLCVLVGMLTFTACTKEEVVDSYVKPQLYLDSCVVNDELDAVAYIRLDMGENFFHHKLQLVLHDMDNTDQQIAAFDVSLSGERVQKQEKAFKLPVAGKAYLASLVMKTDKNSFVSNSVAVASSDMPLKDKFFYTHGTPYYDDDYDSKAIYYTDGVGAMGVAGERFFVNIPKCSTNEEFQLKVGNKIINIVDEIHNGTDGSGRCLFGEIPDLPAGKYDVSLVWRGVDIPLEKKLHILPWKVNVESTCNVSEFEKLPYGTTNTYRIGSKIYYCSVYSNDASHVAYDCATKKWTNLRDIPYNITSIVAVGNKAYAVTNNFDFFADQQSKDFLVEYDPSNDTWKKLAAFPNNGNMCNMDLFAVAGNLYMCDGNEASKSLESKHISQMWKYDLKTGKWKAMGDLPSKLGRNGENRVGYFCGESMGYAMDMANGQLWTYDPVKDKWTYESVLTTQHYGANINIMEYNGKLLYFSYGNSSSAYTYDFKTRKWELKTVYEWGLDNTPIILPMAIQDNRLIVGPFRNRDLIFESMDFFTVDLK